jgi:flagellar L-ring protein precursor FlgH
MLSGCATSTPEAVKSIKLDKAPKYKLAEAPKIMPKNKGSLFSQNSQSLFSDKKDLQIGDIVEITINESLTNTSKDERKTEKKNNTGISGGLSIGTNANTPGDINKAVNTANGLLGISIGGSSANKFEGKASSVNDEKFTTSISAIIEKKYYNGNYFIMGSKTMLINGQKQNILVSGIIRPYDITTDNKIMSSKIANLKVLYNKIGAEADAIDKPWGSEKLEKLSPY